ncbi:MAG: maltose/maltodextrin transport permease-like protein [Planctomycetota bacterium]|nr:MAG: maltose/maltodextrin transport permease-like protein [Planctomycetota bacterium]
MALLTGCLEPQASRLINLWHQMRPEDRAVLNARIEAFERQHPGVKVRALYKETEELRSGLVSAVLARRGPEVIYGPSDVLGVYQAMGALEDMSPYLPPEDLAAFDPRAVIRVPSRDDPARSELVFLGDRFGNHLALVYNKRFIAKAPETTDELVALARQHTVDENGDGVPDRFGIVWNYTEPFFFIPFLTGYGAWVYREPVDDVHAPTPALDTPQAVEAYRFVASLRTEHRVLPPSADYEAARALFLAGKAAMLIDGDWSWQNYLTDENVDAGLAVLPTVSATGLPMAPMVAPKGYSLGSFAQGDQARLAMELIRFLTDAETQKAYLVQQRILPSRLALRVDPLVTGDPLMATSVAQAERGRAMPTDVAMRNVWDAMRPPYQLLLAGQIDAAEAGRRMQRDAIDKNRAMLSRTAADETVVVLYGLGLAAIAALAVFQRHSFTAFFRELRRNRLAYLLVLPAMALMGLTVVYPLAYNVVLSFSNMSLTNLRDWEIIGVKNYASIAAGEHAGQFWGVFLKTLLWTALNVSLHVVLGVLLAVTLHGPVRGKSIYRVLLIIPWAVPAYITALTWRGMFDEQFGAVNHLIRAVSGYLPGFLRLEPLNWLGAAGPAFAACIIANVWLGFPFMMVIALGGLQGIPAELYEAARMDRASRWQQFWHITLPMLKPVLVPAVTLGAVWTFNNLNVVWLVSNGGEPADQTHILVSYVYKAVFNMYQYGYGAALSMVIFLMLLAFSLVFLQRTRATEAVA